MTPSRLLSFAVAMAIGASALSAQPAVAAADLDRLVGPGWVGTLTYRDYSTEARTAIKASLLLARMPSAPATDARWDLRVAYADEPHANSGEIITVSADRRVFRKATVTAREQLSDGRVRIVTEEEGRDNERPARIRMVYLVGDRAASIQKLVRYAGAEYFERHIYEWTR
jgi:hypothetical protein